jgi:regulator of protease activity HflC (stomatin/prohibitin superfamily)
LGRAGSLAGNDGREEGDEVATVTVMDWERVLRFEDGRFAELLGPGRHRYRRRRTVLRTVDMRPGTLVVPGQELLTSDGITVKVSVMATWHVSDPVAYVTGAQSADHLLYAALQIAVRDRVAATTLDDALAHRDRLSAGLADAAGEEIAHVGITLTSALVKDLMLPGELRRAATETMLAREAGRAELERARAEAAALRTMANAAKLLEEHPALLHLRTIQAAGTPGTTIVLSPNPDQPVATR